LNSKEKNISKREEVRKIVEDYPFLPDLSFKSGPYRKIYKSAKNFYFSRWRGKEMSSPAFDGEKVKATRRGFEHLIGKTYTKNRREAFKRLILLPNAKQILETTKEIYEERITINKQNKKVKQYSILGKIENGLVLKVIVHETERTKQKTFLSIFDVVKIKK